MYNSVQFCVHTYAHPCTVSHICAHFGAEIDQIIVLRQINWVP